MSARQRLTFAAIAVAIAVVAIVVAVASGGSGGSGDKAARSAPSAQTTPETGGAEAPTATATTGAEARPRAVRIVVEGGRPVGGIKRISVRKGDRIAFSVQSDVADEVHVHGFDLHKDVAAGGRVSFDFKAAITGVFEVELEAAKTQLASLTINP